MKWGVTKVKHPNKGHTPNKGQKPMYQGVRYSESPLYIYHCKKQFVIVTKIYCHIDALDMTVHKMLLLHR